MLTLFFLVLGLIIGSFLNVCITRIPEELSIVAPGSRCPRCKTPIRPFDNIPVVSWLVLRGKCRDCGLPISPMYPLVELLTGLVFAACYAEFGMGAELFKWLFFAGLVIVLTVTDLQVRMLPDAVNWPGFGIGLVFSAAVPPHDGTALWAVQMFAHRRVPEMAVGLLDGLLGAAFGSLLLWGTGRAYKALRGHEGMGLGDVKMMAMVGTFLGFRGTFLTILVGTFLGSVIGLGIVLTLYVAGWGRGLAERASRRGLGSVQSLRFYLASQYQLPLGTFLGIAALLVVFLSRHPLFYRIPGAH
ncbi:MAG: prepilin peptidase [Acidobacteriia bacterium]|nr:prepilin peptidase [Terriglobia bacterium]